jgi:archaeal flagellar protein FlaI
MVSKTGFEIKKIDFSKNISNSSSGEIVSKNGENFLILDFPKLDEYEKKIFENSLMEIKESNKLINSKKDVYFFLKNYCIENLVLLNKEQRNKIINLLEWEALEESVLTPLLKDENFEEIVINGPKKEILVYHKNFGWLKTNILFSDEEKIKNLVNKMSSTLGRQLSYFTPTINAVLKDGSRLNASMNPVAFSGINVTIRKFKENPLTPIDICEFGTISQEAMSFLWLVMQTSSSILVCGNTGSGKTTTLNSLFCFLPGRERVVIVEETPELMIPQEHKIKLNTAEQVDVGLDKLIENTFRMRPDRVVVGEIRSAREAKAFVDTMLAGQAKGSYCTFHALSAKEAIERLVSFGIDKKSLGALDLIIVQKRQTKIDSITGLRREERKIVEICEINSNETLSLNRIFKYNYKKGILEKCGKSIRVGEKILETFCVSESEIKKMMKKNENILKKLKGKVNFKEFFEIVERDG